MLPERLSRFVVAGLLLLGAIGVWGVHGTHAVALDETQIQAVVDKELGKEFPLKGAAALVVKSASAKSAAVRLHDGQATIVVGIEGALRNGKKFGFTALAQGVPRYDLGGFYFAPEKVEVQDFTYENVGVGEALAQVGAHSLANTRLGQLLRDNAPLAEAWAAGVAETAVREVFERRPVYRLKDDAKGVLLKSSLESITIDGDRVVVAFSLWRLTVSVFMGAAAWIIAALLTIFIIQSPIAAAATGIDVDID